MERGLPQRDCSRLKNKNSDKPETIATDIWHQVGSIFAAYLHSQHTHARTHTHMFEVWVSGSVAESGWLYITTTKSTEQRASGAKNQQEIRENYLSVM